MAISVVIPVRNDETALVSLLTELAPLRGPDFEVVVVEADDSSMAHGLAQGADRWLRAGAGRGLQLQHGVDESSHDCLWFLHADSRDVANASTWLLEQSRDTARAPGWGRFDVRFDDESAVLQMVAWFMNWRSRLTSIATGDQGIYIDRVLLAAVGGWPQQPLMEDVELSARLRRHTSPCLPPRHSVELTTSARRWRANGVWRTIGLMWWLRFCYALGRNPAELERLYYADNKVQVDD